MEAFALYLLKSVIWISGFTIVFIFFLKNERFFFLNRVYLIAGILTALIFPFVSIHYKVILPIVENVQSGSIAPDVIENTDQSKIPDIGTILLALYLSGVLFIISLIFKQSRSLMRAISRSEIIKIHPVKLIRTPDYTSAFSFFSYVFVNPSVTDLETKEILNHELVHIRQKHWFDLMLVELLCLLQWFNPLVWIYIRMIRQNHEYLADEVALQHTSDPAIYRAALLNQIVGSPVVSLTNSFNYSINKKRLNMMKNIISSPYRKMKIFLILPVFAIVLYAFAKPEYMFNNADKNSGNTGPVSTTQIKEVKGTVIAQDVGPLPGAIITVRGTTIGTVTDAIGRFKLGNLSDDAALVVSFVGYKSKVVKPLFDKEMTIKMVSDTVKIIKVIMSPPPPPPPPPVNGGNTGIPLPPPPPPPPPADQNDKNTVTAPSHQMGFKINGDGAPPLFVLDGIIKTQEEIDKVDPQSIESINVLKSYSTKYGDKGKNGVVEITSKKVDSKESENKVLQYKVKGIDSVNEKTNIIDMEPRPLVIVDGVISDIDIKPIDPNTIESISVLKDKSAVALYGEKAGNGVILVTTKKAGLLAKSKMSDVKVTGYSADQKADKDMFVVVEEMPMFPGGHEAMSAWISDNLEYPGKAFKDKIEGVVYVTFVISTTGKVRSVAVSKSVHPLLDAEAVRVVSKMPDWKPGSQNGKSVPVSYNVPVEFKLWGKVKPAESK